MIRALKETKRGLFWLFVNSLPISLFVSSEQRAQASLDLRRPLPSAAVLPQPAQPFSSPPLEKPLRAYSPLLAPPALLCSRISKTAASSHSPQTALQPSPRPCHRPPSRSLCCPPGLTSSLSAARSLPRPPALLLCCLLSLLPLLFFNFSIWKTFKPTGKFSEYPYIFHLLLFTNC